MMAQSQGHMLLGDQPVSIQLHSSIQAPSPIPLITASGFLRASTSKLISPNHLLFAQPQRVNKPCLLKNFKSLLISTLMTWKDRQLRVANSWQALMKLATIASLELPYHAQHTLTEQFHSAIRTLRRTGTKSLIIVKMS